MSDQEKTAKTKGRPAKRKKQTKSAKKKHEKKKDAKTKPDQAKKQGSARGKYATWLESDNLLKLSAWARDGLTDEQIAHNIGINRTTLYDWKKKYPDISDALKKGKEVTDIEVENSLLEAAKGFYYTEEVAFKLKDVKYKDGKKVSESERIEVISLKKYCTPQIAAIIFWLKNRRPDVWKDKQTIENMGMGYEEYLAKVAAEAAEEMRKEADGA